MGKFNSGYLRTVDIQKSFYETKTLPNTNDSKTEPLGLLPLELTQDGIYKPASASNTGGATAGTPGSNSTGASSSTAGVTASTREGT
jgi:hypothetical protein